MHQVCQGTSNKFVQRTDCIFGKLLSNCLDFSKTSYSTGIFQDLKRILKCIMKEKLRDVNIYLQTFCLQLKNDCLQRANETGLNIKIELEEQQKVTDLTYLQVKDKNKLSDMKYKGIANTLKLPSNYMIDKTKKKIDDKINLGSTLFIIKKEHVLQTFIDRNPDFAQTELKIKLSLDSCNKAKPNKTILNVASTHIDDKQTAMSVKGNYLLGNKLLYLKNIIRILFHKN